MKINLICLIWFLGTGAILSMTPESPQAYLKWMQQNLPDVPEWTAWKQKSGELPPEFDRLPRTNLLPDPFRFLDGRPVKEDAKEWEARKSEIRELFQRHVTGTFPPKTANKQCGAA